MPHLRILAAAAASFGLFGSFASAAPQPVALSGVTSTDRWAGLTSTAYPGYGAFPGGSDWPGPIGSNTAGSGDADLNRVAGNPQGDVTVVEFFDYQCGYCKAVQADTQTLIKGDSKLRFVLKEFPILGPASVVASKAALASRGQGKYVEFHNALMAQRGQLDEAVIMRLAKSVGLDTDRLKKDMDSPDVLKVIAANQALAEKLNIRGTPAFVFGDELVPGAIKLDDMKRLTDAARAKG